MSCRNRNFVVTTTEKYKIIYKNTNEMSRENRIALLNAIKDNKHILFAKFSAALTHEDKEKKWKEIEEMARNLHIVGKERDWKYIRDTTWQNWRKRTLEKIEGRNKNKLGTFERKKWRLDVCDKLVLEIVGRENITSLKRNPKYSNVKIKNMRMLNVNPTEISEPHGTNIINQENTKLKTYTRKRTYREKNNVNIDKTRFLTQAPNLMYTINKESMPCANISSDSIATANSYHKENPIILPEQKRKSIKDPSSKVQSSSIPLKRKLMKKLLQLANRERYKIDLKLFKLERELNLPPSKYTSYLYQLEKHINTPPTSERNLHYEDSNGVA